MEPHLADTIRSIPIFSALSREDVAKVLGKTGRRFLFLPR